MNKEDSDGCERTKQFFLWCQTKFPHVDQGHVGIQMGDHIFGFTWVGKEYTGPGVGEMKKETARQFGETYYRRHVEKYLSRTAAGKAAANRNPSVRPVYVYSVCVPIVTFDLLEQRYEEIHLKPPEYNLLSNNCVTTTIESLEELNILKFEYTRRPTDFKEQVDQKIGEENQELYGFVSDLQILHVRRNPERGYFWSADEAIIIEDFN